MAQESAEREQVRESARVARARARALVAETLRLRLLFETLRSLSDANRRESNEVRDWLRTAVSRYSHIMRDLGEPPERVLTMIKETVDEGARDAFGDGAHADWIKARALREEVVRWAIDGYYEIAS